MYVLRTHTPLALVFSRVDPSANPRARQALWHLRGSREQNQQQHSISSTAAAAQHEQHQQRPSSSSSQSVELKTKHAQPTASFLHTVSFLHSLPLQLTPLLACPTLLATCNSLFSHSNPRGEPAKWKRCESSCVESTLCVWPLSDSPSVVLSGCATVCVSVCVGAQSSVAYFVALLAA